MLLLLGLLTIFTGAPVWILLLGVSGLFASAAVEFGVLDINSLTAVPARLVGLLENDLLQALPLYVLVGMLLLRLPLAQALFSLLLRGMSRTGAATSLATLGLGALVAPMNGSVASSSALLGRLVAPRLKGLDAARATALISVSATIGVVVPPSLVLILLGDTMMRAHIEASNLPGFVLGAARIITTQDVFHAALLPALGVLLLWVAVARWQGRTVQVAAPTVPRRHTLGAVLAASTIVLLLAGVFTGALYAVEAAATGCVVLVLATLLTRALNWHQWQELLRDTLALSGALMALLVGATVFSLVFRLLGTDRWLTGQMMASSLPPAITAGLVLLLVGLCAWVLDAFEMIFVVIPVVAPPLIAMLGDPQQAAVLLLLVLQLSFLVPPMGYAVMMARTLRSDSPPIPALLRALLPFLLAQLAVLVAVLCAPVLVHQLDERQETVTEHESSSEVEQRMREMSPSPGSDDDATTAPETSVPGASAAKSR
jgi:TRAP-type mannitol/chloroaromatic compound transport system permease large subunit